MLTVYVALVGQESRSGIGVLSGRRKRTWTMTVTVCERGIVTREQSGPPTIAVAMGGATPKEDGTRTLLQSSGNGNGTAERLVGSPPSEVALCQLLPRYCVKSS